jgi:hypothetical protein
VERLHELLVIGVGKILDALALFRRRELREPNTEGKNREEDQALFGHRTYGTPLKRKKGQASRNDGLPQWN